MAAVLGHVAKIHFNVWLTTSSDYAFESLVLKIVTNNM